MKNKIFILFMFLNRISCSSPYQITYEQHRFFEYSLPINCFNEINNYLPTDLSEIDLNTIYNFVQQYNGKQEVKFVFYKTDHGTRLYQIVANENKNSINSSYKTRQQINVSKNEGFVVTSSEKNLKITLINAIGSVGGIKEVLTIWELIKMYYTSRLDNGKTSGEGDRYVQCIFKPIKGINQLIGVRVIDHVKSVNTQNKTMIRKKCFYIIHIGNKKLLMDENGYVVPGDVININNQIPIKNAVKNLGSKFGYRLHPVLKKRKFHSGQDIRAPLGTEIYSIGEGIVVFAGYNQTYGYVAVVYHGKNVNEGYSTLYAHCSKLLVKKGQKVGKGQLIGLIGSTGRSTGPHLHFEVIDNVTKQRLNPLLVYGLPLKMIPAFLIKNFLNTKSDVQKILKNA